jgi:hypothetical protein
MKKHLFILFILSSTLVKSQVTLPNLQPLQYVNSALGNALNFDGTNTYALCKTYVKDSIVDFTLEFWVKNTGTDGANDRIYSSFGNNVLQIGKNSTQLKLFSAGMGGDTTWQTPCTLELNTWVHIAIVRNSTSLKVYKNASLVGTYTVDGTTNLTSYFRLGSNINGIGENGNFSIDEFRLWKNAIAVNYIQKNMYAPINPTSTTNPNPSVNLVLYYRFDQGTPGSNNAGELGLYNSANSN